MNLSPRKAKTVSVIAFVLSLFYLIFTLVLGAFSATLSMYLLSWQILAGVLVWGVLIAQFYQRTLAEQEKLDAGQLSKAADEGTIFSGGADRMAMMAVAQKRLTFLEKWVNLSGRDGLVVVSGESAQRYPRMVKSQKSIAKCGSDGDGFVYRFLIQSLCNRNER